MTYWIPIILLVIISTYIFFVIRSHINGLIGLKLNKNQIKKIKKEQTFLDWFLYLKFKMHITKISFLFWYYMHIVIAVISIITMFVFAIIHFDSNKTKIFFAVLVAFMETPNFIVYLIYKDRRKPSGWNYHK